MNEYLLLYHPHTGMVLFEVSEDIYRDYTTVREQGCLFCELFDDVRADFVDTRIDLTTEERAEFLTSVENYIRSDGERSLAHFLSEELEDLCCNITPRHVILSNLATKTHRLTD